MRTLPLAVLTAALVVISSLHAPADIPQAFDPRAKIAEPDKVVGAAFLVNIMPLGDYLILTRPFDNNPKHEFFRYPARLKPKLTLKEGELGTFVMIVAKRIKKVKKSDPEFEITSVSPITVW